MKKIISIILLLFVMLTTVFVVGCTDNTSSDSSFGEAQVDYSTDMQIMYHVSGNVPMTKSDSGYYYIGEDGVVIYIDKASKKAIPLCSKPNCTHTDPDTCDAYINITKQPDALVGARDAAIQYYNGYLYAVCGEYDQSGLEYNTYLMRMITDGSQRENITGYFDFTANEWFIHKGYFYCSTDSSIIRISLESPKSKPEIIFETKYYIESNTRAVTQLYAYQNYLYFVADERNEDDEGPGLSTKCINLDTLEVGTFPEIDGYQMFFNFFLEDNLIANYYNKSSNENVYLKCDLNGNIIEEFFRIAHNENLFYSTDGKYIYADNRVRVAKGIDEQQIIKIYDLKMNEIDSYIPPEFESTACNFLNPQDNEYFIFESVDDSGKRILVMSDKSQIGSINGESIEYTKLCKLKWAEDKKQGAYIS